MVLKVTISLFYGIFYVCVFYVFCVDVSLDCPLFLHFYKNCKKTNKINILGGLPCKNGFYDLVSSKHGFDQPICHGADRCS